MGGANNTVHIVSADGIQDWPEMTKQQVAEKLIVRVAKHLAHAKAGAE